MIEKIKIKEFSTILQLIYENKYTDFNMINKRHGHSMKDYCGRTVTVEDIANNRAFYKIKEDAGDWYWKDWMIERPKIELDLE